MKQEDSTTQPDQPTPKVTDIPQAPIQSEPISFPVEAKKGKPGRLQQFFRKALVWLFVVAFAFLAGIIADHYIRYRPLSEALAHTQTELDHANQSISDLQAEIERLNTTIQEANDRITSLEGEGKTLQEELDTAKAHLELLQVLVDISNARLALFLNDAEGTKAALVSTPQRLDNLLPRITEFDANLAQSMPQRLSLIIMGLERDTETAKIDLELLTKNLLDIEAALFGD